MKAQQRYRTQHIHMAVLPALLALLIPLAFIIGERVLHEQKRMMPIGDTFAPQFFHPEVIRASHAPAVTYLTVLLRIDTSGTIVWSDPMSDHRRFTPDRRTVFQSQLEHLYHRAATRDSMCVSVEIQIHPSTLHADVIDILDRCRLAANSIAGNDHIRQRFAGPYITSYDSEPQLTTTWLDEHAGTVPLPAWVCGNVSSPIDEGDIDQPTDLSVVLETILDFLNPPRDNSMYPYHHGHTSNLTAHGCVCGCR